MDYALSEAVNIFNAFVKDKGLDGVWEFVPPNAPEPEYPKVTCGIPSEYIVKVTFLSPGQVFVMVDLFGAARRECGGTRQIVRLFASVNVAMRFVEALVVNRDYWAAMVIPTKFIPREVKLVRKKAGKVF